MMLVRAFYLTRSSLELYIVGPGFYGSITFKNSFFPFGYLGHENEGFLSIMFNFSFEYASGPGVV